MLHRNKQELRRDELSELIKKSSISPYGKQNFVRGYTFHFALSAHESLEICRCEYLGSQADLLPHLSTFNSKNFRTNCNLIGPHVLLTS